MGGQRGFAQEGVVAVEHEGRTLGKAGADLQLRLADVLLTAQIADVGHADAGDDAHIGAGCPRQTVNLAGVAHAHLDDRVLGAAFLPMRNMVRGRPSSLFWLPSVLMVLPKPAMAA